MKTTTKKKTPAAFAPVKFVRNREARAAIAAIAKRACALAPQLCDPDGSRISRIMDLEACHANGCPLDLTKLAGFDDFNLLHDVCGIASHLDRKTGKLTGHFLPRATA